MFNKQGWAALKPHFLQRRYRERLAETFVTAKARTCVRASRTPSFTKEITSKFVFYASSVLASQYTKYKLEIFAKEKKASNANQLQHTR